MSSLRPDIQIEYQDLFTSSTTQSTDLGAKATTGDGRYYRYALVGATSTVAGQLYQGPASDPTNYSPSGGQSVGQANATGATGFTISNSLTVTANALAGGLAAVVVTPGIGQSYQIKSNSAVSSATGLAITLADALRTNLSTASRIVFYPNPYNGVVVVGSIPTGPIVGVAPSVITNAQYGWLQVRGICGVLIGGTPGSGQEVGLNLANTTGSVAPATGVWFTPLGNMTATGASGEYDVVNLTIE